MRIALLGGSFNPVHNGHLSLAHAVHSILGYDLVILVPANLPPHKELDSGSTAFDRLEMLRLGVGENSALAVDDCEIVRGGVSWTVDTVRYLCEKYGSRLEGKPGLVIGEDLAAGFSRWRDVPVLVDKTDIIVARRPGNGDVSFPWPHIQLENPPFPLSSSEIRAAIASGKSWRSLVPDPVYRYIVSHTLYEYRPV